MSADWSLVAVDALGVETGIGQATSRSVTWRLDGLAEARFTIRLEDEAVPTIVPYATDLILERNNARVYRGKFLSPVINLGIDQRRIEYTTFDYRGILDLAATVPPGGLRFDDVDQADIAWNLIDAYQQRPGGDRGITRGVGQVSGVDGRDVSYEAGAPIGQLITNLSRVINGFDWEISPDLELNMWHDDTRRGGDKVRTLDYGKTGVATAKREPSTQPFGTHWDAYGEAGTTPAASTLATVATDPRGRWERSIVDPNVSRTATLQDKADFNLDAGLGLQRWTLGLALNAWGGPTDLWLGDTFTLSLKAPNLEVLGRYRVEQITATIGQSDEESIVLGVTEVAA